MWKYYLFVYFQKRKIEKITLAGLIVIGNGFDLAHGLNTKYSDFMKYLTSYEVSVKWVDSYLTLTFFLSFGDTSDIIGLKLKNARNKTSRNFKIK